MVKNLGSMVLAGLASALLAGCNQADATGHQAGSVPSERKVVFEDGFDSATLDRDRWNVVGPEFWVNDELQAYVDSPETISFRDSAAGADGGVLVLRPVWQPDYEDPLDRDADFISGRINTKDTFDFTFGRAAARIRMPDAVGVWPAFWALGYGQWPDGGEIDIMEYVGEKDWYGVAIHGPGYSGETPLVNKYFFGEGEDATGWHEYAVEWTPDQLLFQIDGRTMYRVTRAMAENYGEWRSDRPHYLILNFALGGAYPGKTNGIKEPYYGLPADTVEAIKRGEVEMEVDWVKVWAQQDR